MIKALVPFLILVFTLQAKENNVDQDIWERYTELCTRTEWMIRSDHEYYMMDVSKSYGLQSVRDANDELYVVLIHSPVFEKNLLKTGVDVLKAFKKSQIQKILILLEQQEKSRVTFYSFSSVN